MYACIECGVADEPDPAPHLRAIAGFLELVTDLNRTPAYRDRLLRLSGVPLTRSGSAVLSTVERGGPIAVSDLADRLGVDQSTASRQIKPLEERGLIRRTSDPADRRSSLLSITAAGRRVRSRVRETVRADIDTALREWSPAECERLGVLLDRFGDALRATLDSVPVE
jgi:DNA-binding MarR family transcriptional regulator